MLSDKARLLISRTTGRKADGERDLDAYVERLETVANAARVLDSALHPTPRSRGLRGMGDGIYDHDGPNAIKATALLHAALAALDSDGAETP